MNSAPRNILYVSHTADLRGSAMSLRELMTNLDRQRWQAHALLSKHGPLEEVLAQTGIPFRVLTERGLFKLSRIAAARSYMRQHSIDLVHLNSAVPFCRDVGIAARLAGIPVVWHLREDPQSKRVRRLSPWIRLLTERIIVVSSDLEERFRSSGKVIKVYNGIDLERFSPEGSDGDWRRRLAIDADEFVFVLVGTIERRKGQYLAIEAAARLMGQRVRPFHLVVVGGALNSAEQSLLDDALAGHPQVRPYVHCVGSQPQQEVAALLQASNCLVLPSAWEGFPRTVAEAMACGLPVIVSRVGEIPQMVSDGVEGWLMPEVSEPALAATMQRALTSLHPEELGNKARQRARSWSTRAHVEKIGAIYAEILTGALEDREGQT